MNYLYLLLNLSSISIPFLFSFHPKLKFYKLWKPLFISIIISMLIFIPWDIIFTINSIWGFNSDYLLGLNFFNLPFEEWLFFICIPYACVFTHYALLYYFPKLKIPNEYMKTISYFLIFIFTAVIVYNYDKWYTLINFTLAILLIYIVLNKRPYLLSSYLITFIVMLIPFFIINGVLTGSLIQDEVVWYNNAENLNLRILTIPIEDSVYAFSLILLNLFLVESLKKKAH